MAQKPKYEKPRVIDLDIPKAWGAQCKVGIGVSPTGPGNCKTGYSPVTPGVCQPGNYPQGSPNDCLSGLGV